MAAGMAGGSVVIRFATRAGIVIQVWDWSSSNNIIDTINEGATSKTSLI